MSRRRGSVDTARTKQGDSPARGKPDRAYVVGYGRPPIESRFQPGTSGNPRGRRKGSKKSQNPDPESNDGECFYSRGYQDPAGQQDRRRGAASATKRAYG